jgi:hypothetical protein
VDGDGRGGDAQGIALRLRAAAGRACDVLPERGGGRGRQRARVLREPARKLGREGEGWLVPSLDASGLGKEERHAGALM